MQIGQGLALVDGVVADKDVALGGRFELVATTLSNQWTAVILLGAETIIPALARPGTIGLVTDLTVGTGFDVSSAERSARHRCGW